MNLRKLALAFAFAVAALCVGAPAAWAQSSPVPYWTTAWPAGFGAGFAAGQGATSYMSLSGLSGFDGSGTAVSSFTSRFDLPNGWFVGSERGGLGFNGVSGNWSSLSGLSYEGTQVGYNFRDAAVPTSIYAGFGTLKYNNSFVTPLPGFDSNSSTNSPGYRVNAGVEFRPASNLSVSFGASFAQPPQSTGYDGIASSFRGR